MTFRSLASSSHGNAYVVCDRDTRILIECGISHKQLRARTEFSLAEIHGCLVSHEHQDHAKSVPYLVQDGIPVFMSQGTAEALGRDDVEIISSMEQFRIGSLDVVPFATFHDAREPLGFLIKSRIDGDILAFATDTVNLRYRFPGLTTLAIEANYDRTILERCTRMPEKTRRRITNSHMEIGTLCDYLRGLDLRCCREIHLLHLSDATSHEDHFVHKIQKIVPPGISVAACPRR